MHMSKKSFKLIIIIYLQFLYKKHIMTFQLSRYQNISFLTSEDIAAEVCLNTMANTANIKRLLGLVLQGLSR